MTLRVKVDRLVVAGKLLVHDVAITVEPGTVHTLMGASGSGKSTLLAAICGTACAAVRFDGSVSLDGKGLDGSSTRRRRIGILFQDDLLFAHMTVRENLLFAVPPGPRTAREDVVREALHDLELPGFADADPATLSGGQRARISLMRALLAQPRALLLDEPFSGLDAALRDRMRAYVFNTVRSRAIPALLVTHDEADVADSSALTRLAQPLAPAPQACAFGPAPAAGGRVEAQDVAHAGVIGKRGEKGHGAAPVCGTSR